MTDTATTVDPETVAASTFCADHLAAVELLLARQINGLASDVQRQGSTARRSGNRLSWATDTIDFWSVAKSVSSVHCAVGLLNGKGFIFVLVVGNDHR